MSLIATARRIDTSASKENFRRFQRVGSALMVGIAFAAAADIAQAQDSPEQTNLSRAIQAAEDQSDSPLIQPVIPVGYDRGRNISVEERARPDYDPLGIQRGSIIYLPRLDLGAGAADNIFATQAGRTSDVYGYIAPSLKVTTDWDSNQVLLQGGGTFEEYGSHAFRDQTEWYFKGLGRLDVSSDFSLTAETQITRTQEEPFSGDATASIGVLSHYRRDLAGLKAEFDRDRFRTIVSYDFQDFNFAPAQLTSGATYSQANRDRQINRGALQTEYALSPSTAIYAQGTYVWTDYSTDLAAGVANRDSTGWRAIAGLSMDVSGFFRGNIGIGYTARHFRAGALYPTVAGFSAEAKLEYFPAETTTVKLDLSRVIEDADIASSSGYFNNGITLGVDQQVRDNIILSAGGDFAAIDYIGVTDREHIWHVRGGGTYLLNHMFQIRADVSYADRRRFDSLSDFSVNETAGRLTLIIQR